jgi:hypothetical protein
MTGWEDLDRHGRWDQHPELRRGLDPGRRGRDWAPYRDGRWAWVRPWGWTWVDDAPWGFAPVPLRPLGRVAWPLGAGCRAAYVARPVFAPALVAWIDGPRWRVGVRIGGPTSAGCRWRPGSPTDPGTGPARAPRLAHRPPDLAAPAPAARRAAVASDYGNAGRAARRDRGAADVLRRGRRRAAGPGAAAPACRVSVSVIPTVIGTAKCGCRDRLTRDRPHPWSDPPGTRVRPGTLDRPARRRRSRQRRRAAAASSAGDRPCTPCRSPAAHGPPCPPSTPAATRGRVTPVRRRHGRAGLRGTHAVPHAGDRPGAHQAACADRRCKPSPRPPRSRCGA